MTEENEQNNATATTDDITGAEGDAQLWVGRALPTFIQLAQYVTRCYAVTVNLIRQFASLYHPQQRLYEQSYRNVHLTHVFAKLGELLETLITVDHVILANPHLPVCWGMYKRCVDLTLFFTLSRCAYSP